MKFRAKVRTEAEKKRTILHQTVKGKQFSSDGARALMVRFDHCRIINWIMAIRIHFSVVSGKASNSFSIGASDLA